MATWEELLSGKPYQEIKGGLTYIPNNPAYAPGEANRYQDVVTPVQTGTTLNTAGEKALADMTAWAQSKGIIFNPGEQRNTLMSSGYATPELTLESKNTLIPSKYNSGTFQGSEGVGRAPTAQELRGGGNQDETVRFWDEINASLSKLTSDRDYLKAQGNDVSQLDGQITALTELKNTYKMNVITPQIREYANSVDPNIGTYTTGTTGTPTETPTGTTGGTGTTPSVDDLISKYMSGLTEGVKEREEVGKQAITSNWERATPKLLEQAAGSRQNLDSGGYQALRARIAQESEQAKQNQLADLANTYSSLISQGYGQALSGALNLKSMGQSYDLGKSGQALEATQIAQQKKQWEDQLKNMTEQLRQSSLVNQANIRAPYVQRSFDIADRSYYENLANRLGRMNTSQGGWGEALSPIINAAAMVMGGSPAVPTFGSQGGSGMSDILNLKSYSRNNLKW